ncbi:imm11 family protein [Pyxidicoccus sp. 3LG]
MPKRYFDLSDDVYIPGRWHLHTPRDEHGQEVNPWQFTKGNPVQLNARLKMPLQVNGAPLDFTLGGLDIPVVRAHVADLLAEVAPDDLQILPVDIEGQKDPFRIVVATRLIECIDDQASEEARHWKPEDGRPEKVGKYRVVRGMRIDPSKVGNAHVFRPWGWTVALIVSEDIKQALEDADVTGTKFKEV